MPPSHSPSGALAALDPGIRVAELAVVVAGGEVVVALGGPVVRRLRLRAGRWPGTVVLRCA
jgi:hypothetical protein